MRARRVKVAFCLDSFNIGGSELNAVRTAEAIDPDRIELRVFHIHEDGPLRSRYERLGLKLTSLAIPNLYSFSAAKQGIRFASIVRHEQIDIVHSHDIYCNIFAVPWARMMTKSHTIASRRWGLGTFRASLMRANRWSYAFAHRVLANSAEVANLIVTKEGVPRNKIEVVPNFLSPHSFESINEDARIQQLRDWGIPSDAFVVGIVARLSPVKNHRLLFEAIRQLGDKFHLLVIGDGPSRSELEASTKQSGIANRVHFVGEIISNDNLHRYFDVSVLCSVSEGFPNSIIEAMAAARPVVATGVGGVVDAIEHGNTGFLIPLNDPGPLVSVLKTLAADDSLRENIGERAQQASRGVYRQDVVIERLSSLYEDLALN